MVDVFRDRVAGFTRLSQHLSLSLPLAVLAFSIGGGCMFFYLWVFNEGDPMNHEMRANMATACGTDVA